MTEQGWIELAVAVIGIFAAIIGYLLAARDNSQAEQIKELFNKHDNDAKALEELRLKIAENHLSKSEVEKMFENFKEYLNERFDRVEEMASRIHKNGQGNRN